MTVRIDSVLKDAVNGVQAGLSQARQASSQLAIASPEDAEASSDSDKSSSGDARVVKDMDETLGTLVDVKV